MSLLNIYQISSQGMSAQRERLEAAATNLANANTTRTAAGGPYRRRDVVLESISSASAFDGPLGANNSRVSTDQPDGVRARTLISENSEGIKRHMPGHPDADAGGYVTLPDVDSLEETVNLMSAARAFEANVTAFNTAKELARASLRLGEA